MKRGSIAIGAVLVAAGLAGGIGVAQMGDRPEPQQRDVVVRPVSDDDATTPPSPDSTTPAASPAAKKTSKERTTVTEQQTTETKPTPAPTARRTTGTGTADIVPDPLDEPIADINRCADEEGGVKACD